MPYNNTAIPPTHEITGAATLPLARVKKILVQDDDINYVSANAAFAITIATEMFIRYLAESAMTEIRAEKKPRRNLQYRDIANAVNHVENLQFLEDIVPKTTSYREFKARKGRTGKDVSALANGQTVLDAEGALQRQPELDQREVVMEGSNGTGEAREQEEQPKSNGHGPLVFEHYDPATNGTSRRDEGGDVEMT